MPRGIISWLVDMKRLILIVKEQTSSTLIALIDAIG